MHVLRSSCAVLLITGAACTASGKPLTDAERATIAASIDSATRAFEAAERARDAERVLDHLAPEFYMYNDGVRVGYESVATQIRETIPTLRHFEPGFAALEVLVLGRNGGVVSFTFRDSMIDASGTLMQFRGPTTLVWERRGTDWLIAYADADHYSK